MMNGQELIRSFDSWIATDMSADRGRGYKRSGEREFEDDLQGSKLMFFF